MNSPTYSLRPSGYTAPHCLTLACARRTTRPATVVPLLVHLSHVTRRATRPTASMQLHAVDADVKPLRIVQFLSVEAALMPLSAAGAAILPLRAIEAGFMQLDNPDATHLQILSIEAGFMRLDFAGSARLQFLVNKAGFIWIDASDAALLQFLVLEAGIMWLAAFLQLHGIEVVLMRLLAITSGACSHR